MCNYCGCRDFPLISQLTDEHEAIANAAGRLRRAITDEQTDPVAALDELLHLLMPHTGTEESGLFAELRAEGSLSEAVDKLCAEHDDIHGVLTAVDRAAPDWPAVLPALDRLRRHIDNEEHGLFPAAVISLPIEAWDRITVSGKQLSSESAVQLGIEQRQRFLGGVMADQYRPEQSLG